jgi:Kef-type K+ transport system membrane component KefB
MNILVVILKVGGFFRLTILLGHFVMPKITEKLYDREGKAFTFAITTALTLAYLAELVGLHLIIGAFLAGQFVSKEIKDRNIYESICNRFYGISYGFLVPVFFASLSFHLHLYWNWSFIGFSLIITLVAVIGKLVGCGLGFSLFRRNFWESVVIGFGMNGRGAVEIVVASVVVTLSDKLLSSGVVSEPLLTQDQFSALILMAFLTTLMAPLTLKWAVLKACQADEQAMFCRLWEESKTP